MNHDPNVDQPVPAGFGGSLRLLGALAVLVLAVAGVLIVLEIIPRSAFADIGGKVLGVGGILAVALVALSLLMRRQR